MATKWISPTWRMPEESNQSKFENYSLEFNGTDDEIDCGNSDAINITGPISISVWFNADNTDGARGIVCKNDAAAQQTYAQYFFDLLSNEIRWRAGRNTVSYGINTGQWYHAVGVYDGSDITLYIDGTSVATDSALSTSYASSQPLYIGRRLNQDYFEGEIGQVAIYDSALSASQVSDLWNSGTPVNPMALTPLPVAYYPLGGGSTGDSADPATTLTVPNESVPSATVFDFNGSDKINTKTLTEFGISNEFTISTWIKPSSLTNYGLVLVATSGSGWTDGMGIYYLSNKWHFFVDNYSSGDVISTTTATTGIWYHIVGTFSSSGTVKLYINGVEEGTPVTGITLDGLSETLVLGSSNVDGEYSNTQIWNKKLISSEVATIYNNGVPFTGTQPQAANLKAWYKMNVDTSTWDGTDWTISNSSANYPNSLQFNGTSSYIDTSSFTTSGDDVTISLWLNAINIAASSPSTTGALVYGDTNNFIYYNVNETIYAKINGSASYLVANSGGVPQIFGTGDWHHLAVVKSGSTVTWYVDGSPFSDLGTGGSGGFTMNYIGAAGGSSIYFLNGQLSNVAIFESALDASAITTLYNGGQPETAISSSPLSWWKLDNLSTGIQDSGSASNNGTNYGATISGIAVSQVNGTSSGMTTANLVNSDLNRSIPYSSYSMAFDGLTEDIRCGNSLGSSLSQAEYVTVSCWVYFNDTTEEQGLWNFRSGDNTNDVGTSLSLYSSGTVLRLAYYEGGNNGYVSISNPGFSNENWYNIICVYDKGAAGKIYINGQAQTVVDSGIYSTVDFSSDNFYIGSYYSSTYATNGNLSNISVWNSELTSDQVLTVYNGGVPSDISSLSPTRWWSLSGDSYFNGNDWICPNLTSSSNNGTSYNLGPTDLIGNGPGSTANGTATSMDIPTNLKGNAPNSSKNAFSINMNSADRLSGITNTPGTDSDVLSFLSSASITNTTQQTAINNLVLGLKSNMLWDKMLAIYPYVGGTDVQHSYNLKNPSSFQLSWSSGITHSSNGVYVGGYTSYGDTGATMVGLGLTQSETSIGTYIVDWTQNQSMTSGVYGSEFGTNILSNALAIWVSAGNYYFLIGNWYINANTPKTSEGFIQASRSSNTQIISKQHNGSIITTTPNTVSGAYPDNSTGRSVLVLSSNRNNSVTRLSTHRFQYFGKKLTSTELDTMYTIVQAYQTELGRQM